MSKVKVKQHVDVDERTTLVLECQTEGDAIPCELLSSARDLDAALDRAAQYYGAPLDAGAWAPAYVEDGATWHRVAVTPRGLS